MKGTALLIYSSAIALALAAPTADAICKPHGCDWVSETTTVTNFTFTKSSNNDTCQGVTWQYLWSKTDPRTCSALVSQPMGSRNRIACVEAHPIRNDTFWPGWFTVVDTADDGSSIDVDFSLELYEGCAANIYGFTYGTKLALPCTPGPADTSICTFSGNITIEQQYCSMVNLSPSPFPTVPEVFPAQCPKVSF
jgi:hypothetical protein